MSAPSSKYLIHTPELGQDALRYQEHPMDSKIHHYSISLGDSTGLTKLGVHFYRLPPGATSTMLHYHTMDDEYYYIVDAGGDDAVLVTWEASEEAVAADKSGGLNAAGVTREEPIKTGDFLGFKAGTKGVHAHALRAGSKEVVYIVGGNRSPLDLVVYPSIGKSLLVDWSEKTRENSWVVDTKELEKVDIPAPAALP
ncbi:hypothetical protein C2E23DRAFT_841375 [Lenzites betulinus]|nr:hypothetical protein C2E23DRAFT_841375 [Lenzites betulinus]